MYNQLMKNNFNIHANTYDSHSGMQLTMAEKLFKNIRKNKYKNIFEIGCGTGHLSKLLIGLKPDELYLNDVSKNMLETTKNKINTQSINFIEKDFEEYQFGEKFDLIISNAVLQWIKQLEENFVKINNALNKSGCFAFTIFIEGTFIELIESFKKTYSQLHSPYENHVLDFYSMEIIKENLLKAKFKILSFKIKKYKIFYKSPLDFLKELRSIGASHFNEKNVKYNIMRKMINNYINDYSEKNKMVRTTYKVLYCKCKKS